MSTETTGSASIEIAAGADTVWDLIANVEQMGDWSPETYRAEWLSGGPSPGAQFRGYNRLGDKEWSSECEVLTCTPGEEFTFHVLRVATPAGERDIRPPREPPGGATEFRGQATAQCG
ncbi:MAG: SRPBCC family protein [Actinomycetota bacterium]|nr:SRPBCC family protein [Actinomycetota bacterium]